MDFIEQGYFEMCKTLIEQKFYPDKGNRKMRQRDFEYLINLIEEVSGIKLSISTLRRLWKADVAQYPHPSTLDALVAILGYRDWLEFKMQNTPKTKPDDKMSLLNIARSKKSVSIMALTAIIIISLTVLAVLKFDLLNTNTTIDSQDVLFTANKTVTVGVPSTVIFHYDFKGIQADSFFIQQDWNPKHKDPVDPKGKYFSSIYYLPGYHKAKLIADTTILKIQPVHIQTDGWMSAVMYNYNEPPVYLPKDQNHDGIFTTSEQDIRDSHVEIERFFQLTFRNIRRYGNLDGHNFKFNTRFKYREFQNTPCPYMQATIHTEVNIYFVGLTTKGCVGNLAVKIGEVVASGRDNDLSAFGTDINQWQNLSLYVVNKTGTIYLNGEKIYETTFKQDFGKIVGIDYRFYSGLGDLDYVELTDVDDNVVYKEDFE